MDNLQAQTPQAGPAAPGMPIRDLGSFVYQSSVSDAEIKDHRSQDTVYVGLHMPRPHRHRRARHRHGHGHSRRAAPQSDSIATDAPPPSQHIQFLLGEEEDDDEHRTHDLFCEMGELFTQNGEMEWKETARWIKFEEDVEEGGERWSKPHVATLSLHSLFELRSCIHNGTVILDMDAQYFYQVIDITLDAMVANNQLENMIKDQIRDVLLMRHRHLNEKHDKKHREDGKHHLPLIRSLADIGKKYSLPRDLGHHNEKEEEDGTAAVTITLDPVDDLKPKESKLKGVKTMPNFQNIGNIQSNDTPKLHQSATQTASLKRNESSGNDLGMHKDSSSMKLNLHFMKKIPPGAEAANILVGEVDCLNHMIIAFLRLSKSTLMGDLTEVPVPTKFLFILLGPAGNQSKYHEIGRSIATLMSDEIFHDVAYHAHNREDLLAGIDEFLDQVTVLPPGEWDPSIRIEPPKSVPSQESRKTKGQSSTPMPNGKAVQEEEEEESHGDDPALQRTGRLFGGLISDIRRKLPHYLDDYKDALHVQSLASFMFLYFACLTPIITFGGLLSDATGKDLAALESLLAGCIVGVTYALFSGQPLTILGSTGPILVFETIMYNFCKDNELHYLSFRFWVGLWTGLILLVMVAFDLSALVRYITRFTEESFAALISLIFIKEAFAKLIDITHKYSVNLDPLVSPFHDCVCLAPDDPLVTTTLSANDTSANTTTPSVSANTTLGVTTTLSSVSSTLLVNVTNAATNMTNATTNVTEEEKQWHLIPRSKCEEEGGFLAGEGCHHVADVFFFSVLLFLGTFTLAYSLKSIKTTRFFPSKVRSIISDFAVMIAIVIMVTCDLLLGLSTPKLEVPEKFEPTNKEHRGWVVVPFNEKNPWWICIAAVVPALLGTILIFMDQQITAVIVNRKENKLTKGCGYHLDLFIVAILIMINSLLGLPWFVAATVLSINHVMSLKKESECTAPGERPKFLGVREQRVTGIAIFLVIGLSVLLTGVLKYIPMPVLYGVFLYMGVSSLKGMQLVNRIFIIFMPIKYQPDYIFLRHVRTRRVHFFTVIQVACLALLWVIKTVKVISIAFPIMVLAMCFIRKALDWVFTQTELKWLDDIMPELHKREKEDKNKEKEQQQKEEEYEAMLDPKNANENQIMMKPKASIINLAINASQADSLDSSMNISEEISKTSNWRTLQANETPTVQDTSDRSSERSLSGKRKHKKHSSKHKKDDDKLPTIPSSPIKKGNKKGVGFYIDEAEELIEKPTIVVDPPSDSSSLLQNNDHDNNDLDV